MLLVVAVVYLVLLPLWWYSLDGLSALVGTCADLAYRLFDSRVSINPSGKVINFYVSAGEAGTQPYTSALKTDTISYGMPMLVALIVATRSNSILAKVRALVVGVAVMVAASVPAVMVWGKVTSLQHEEQVVLSASGGGRSSFLFYAFHGYAFSQPVVAVGVWLALLFLGFFNARPKREEPTLTVARNEPCPCGSGLKYKRCCGRT